jgi:hypothetical protein
MVAIDICTDLDARGGHKKGRTALISSSVASASESAVLVRFHEGVTIPSTHAAGDGDDIDIMGRKPSLTQFLFEVPCTAPSLSDGVQHNSDCTTGFLDRFLYGPFCELFAGISIGLDYLNRLGCVKPVAHLFLANFAWKQPERSPSCRGIGDYFRRGSETGRPGEQIGHRLDRGTHADHGERCNSISLALDGCKGSGKWRAEVRFIERDKTVVAQKPGLKGSAPWPDTAIGAEEQARTYHVHRTDHDCRS